MDHQNPPSPPSTPQQALKSTLPPIPKVRYTFECDDDALAHWHVRHFELQEELSAPYSLVLDLTTSEMDIELNQILGDSCSFVLDRAYMQRSVFGIVDQVMSVGVSAGRLHVRLRVVPALTLLRQRINTQIWQDQTVPEILEAVLKKAFADYKREYRLELSHTYEKRDFCVQYRESDFAFVSRLMEEEGITYYFEQNSDCGKEVLVLIDNNAADPELELAGGPEISIISTNEGAAHVESIQDFQWFCTLHSTSVVQRDYSWLTPPSPIVNEDRTSDARGRDREVYDPSERRLHEVLEGERTASMIQDGARQALLKREELAVDGDKAHGTSNVIEFAPGYLFTLDGHLHVDLNRKYLITKVVHTGDMPEENILEGAADAGGERYENHFECMPAEIPFRVQRKHSRPKIYGPQTALVTGPQGEEVHTDEHGRIKVLFRWDRLSPPDENSSFWVRVAQNWAGAGWGSWFLPRIGMEVVVEFLDGNPDRPLVTGCVYNGAKLTPYKLPDEKTKSTIMTQSSLGGDGFNELRFEDIKGNEQVFIRAERNKDVYVKNDAFEDILNNSHQTVQADQFEKTVKNKHTTIEENQEIHVLGNRRMRIGDGDRGGLEHTVIEADKKELIRGNHHHHVEQNHVEKIDQSYVQTMGNNWVIEVGNNQQMKVSGESFLQAATAIIQAGQGITLKGPGGFITIDASGVTIQGTLVRINSGGSALSPQGCEGPEIEDAENAEPTVPEAADDGFRHLRN